MGMESNLNNQERPRKLSLVDLLSEEPIHGLGYKRFDQETRDRLDDILNRNFGLSIKTESLGDISPRGVREIMDYLEAGEDEGVAEVIKSELGIG